MKLTGRDATRFLARPDPAAAGMLLFGPDAMRVALKRQALVETLVGPDAAAEMRLTRIAGADLRRDPAALLDAARATGFFPGARAVLVEDATDGLAEIVLGALADWREGDARIVVAAGDLKPSSSLRKGFEAARAGVAIGIYDDPPGRDEIEAALVAAGLGKRFDREAMGEIEALARALDPGDFGQFVEKLGLYKRGDATPLSLDDIAACAPPTTEEADEVVLLAADGEARRVAAAFGALAARGTNPVGLAIAAGRHYRTLYAAACAADGPDAALARARPPVRGPKRTRMAAQARTLGPAAIEQALRHIMDAELALRSSRPIPAAACVERLFVRLATLKRG